MTHTFETKFSVGEDVETRWAAYGGEWEKSQIKKISYEMTRDGNELVYTVRLDKHKRIRYKARQNNIRKIL